METINIPILTIGAGLAGTSFCIYLQSHLKKPKNSILIDSGCSNSILSDWDILKTTKSELELLLTKNNKINHQDKFLKVFIDNYYKSLENIFSFGVKFFETDFSYSSKIRYPGKVILDYLKKQYTLNGGKIVEGYVNEILFDKNQNRIVGVIVKSGSKNIRINCGECIVASGGLTNLMLYTTGNKQNIPNIPYLLYKAGVILKEPCNNYFVPLVIFDKGINGKPVPSIVKPHIKLINDNNTEIVGRNNITNMSHVELLRCLSKNINVNTYVSISMDKQTHKKYLDNDIDFKNVFIKHGLTEIKKLRVMPAFHYSIGGILKQDIHGKTNIRNVYVIGECSYGLFKSDRTKALALLEAYIFGQQTAEYILNKNRWDKIQDLKNCEYLTHNKLSLNIKEDVWKKSLGYFNTKEYDKMPFKNL